MILIAKPKPVLQGSYWVFRGGCWFNLGQFCRSAARDRDEPTIRYYSLGFRVILRKRLK